MVLKVHCNRIVLGLRTVLVTHCVRSVEAVGGKRGLVVVERTRVDGTTYRSAFQFDQTKRHAPHGRMPGLYV